MGRAAASFHRFRISFLLALAGFVGALAVAGCGDSASNIEVPPLQIITTTTGSGLDADGYTASIDGGSPLAVGVNDTVVVGDAGPGTHVVELSGVASNCQVEGSSSDTIAVTTGATTDAAFTVTCAPLPVGDGQIVVTTATTGSTTGSANYAILLDGRRIGTIAPNGTTTAGGIAAGSHAVGLDSLPAGCQVDGDNPTTLMVGVGSSSTVSFAISCGASGEGSITKWTTAAGPRPPRLYDVWGSGPADFWAVGTDLDNEKAGVIEHFNGTAWVADPGRADVQLDAVWGSGPSDVYAVGAHNDKAAGAILHYDGSAWTEITGPSIAPPPGDTLVIWQSVWGLSGSDVYVVGSSYGTRFTALVAHYDGSQWTLSTLPATSDREPLDIWGTSPQDLYVSGVLHDPADTSTAHDRGLVLHYDGASWTESLHGPDGVHLKAVWGASADNVYVVGDPGVIFRWDGASWTEQPQLITTALHEIWGTSAGNIYVVAARGHILHFDGTQWSEMDSPTTNDLYGLWGSAPDDAWTVGNGSVIVHGTK